MLRLGNDIVSLKQAGIQNKSRHSRFLDRVFTSSEQSAIANSSNPDAILWMMWAAKEAAYKVISKIQPLPIFAHKKFEVIEFTQDIQNFVSILIKFTNIRFSGFAQIREDYVHVFLGTDTFSQNDVSINTHRVSAKEKQVWGNREAWSEHFTQKELESIHHWESACIRHLCKTHLAKLINCDSSQLQIIRPAAKGRSLPPFLLIAESPCDIDISLSHHESWLAWVFSFASDSNLGRQT